MSNEIKATEELTQNIYTFAQRNQEAAEEMVTMLEEVVRPLPRGDGEAKQERASCGLLDEILYMQNTTMQALRYCLRYFAEEIRPRLTS